LGKGIAGLALLYAVAWSFLLLPWVLVGENNLTGAEVSQVLVSLPAVAVLMILIALYRRFPKLLVLLSGATMLIAAAIAFSTDFTLAPTSLQLQEALTGVVGDSNLGEATLWPYVFAALAGVSALLSLWVATLPVSTKARVDETGANDTRSIWDEQV